jgi:hypothetical protein
MIQQFWRIMRLLAALSIVIAGIAVVLVAQGDDSLHIHMLIATALMAAGCVLIAGALMTLVFLSSRSGHDEQAKRSDEDSHQ